MNHRKKIKTIFTLALFGVVIGLTLALPEKTGLCSINDIDCIHRYIYKYDTLATVLVVFLIPISLIALILYFISEQVFISWFRFTKYYLPIAAALIIFSPAIDSSIFGFDKEFMTWLLAGIFFVASLGIIIFSARGGSASGEKRQSLGHPVSK